MPVRRSLISKLVIGSAALSFVAGMASPSLAAAPSGCKTRAGCNGQADPPPSNSGGTAPACSTRGGCMKDSD